MRRQDIVYANLAGQLEAQAKAIIGAMRKTAPKRLISKHGKIDMTDIVVVIGAGSIGQAIARRVSAGKHVLLADLRQDNADAAARTLSDAGFDVSRPSAVCSMSAEFTVACEVTTIPGTR